MAILPPKIHTYHCLCTSLLLASTHALSTLPRRSPSSDSDSDPSSSTEGALILPIPSAPPEFPPITTSSSTSDSEVEGEDGDAGNQRKGKGKAPADKQDPTIPPQGYTILLSLLPDRSTTIIRREDGFEKRVLLRCGRCRVVVGYELLGGGGGGGGAGGGDAMDIDGEKQEAYKGKVVYLLPGGIMSTDAMARGEKIGEGDVEFLGGGVGVFE